jgi:hypothetical protein
MSFVIGRGRYGRETYSSPPSGGASAGTSPLSVVNTGTIPASGPSAEYFAGLGGDGMPAPSTYTSKTGRVKVTVQVQITPTQPTAGYILELARDFSLAFGAEIFVVSTPNDSADGLGPSAWATLVGIDTVTPGSSHSWGVLVTGIAGATQMSSIDVGRLCVTVEDIAP